MSVIYKILCEVKLLHEYYLTEAGGVNIFGFASQGDRLAFLQKQFLKKVPDITDDFEFVFPDSLSSFYRGQHLRVIATYSGFRIFIGCRKKLLSDGTLAYEPLSPLPPGMEIMIAIRPKGNARLFSQSFPRKPFHAGWYFCNDVVAGGRSFPFLSSPVAARSTALSYTPGEIASVGAGVSMFLDNSVGDGWSPITGTGYASDADQLLVPSQFTYYFTEAEQMRDAEFVLKDVNGDEIKKIRRQSEIPVRSMHLNFVSGINQMIRSSPQNVVAASSFYTLDVTGSNGYSRSYRMLFTDSGLSAAEQVGIISIRPIVDDSDYHLVFPDGHLPLLDAVGNPRIPVYEIWMKSKLVFLKYRHNRQQKLKLSPITTGLLKSEDGVLVSKSPVGMSYQLVDYRKEDNVTWQWLPNPSLKDAVHLDGNRSYVQMMVPESEIFPLL